MRPLSASGVAVALLLCSTGGSAISSSGGGGSSWGTPSSPTDTPTPNRASRPNHHLFPWATLLLAGGATTDARLRQQDGEAEAATTTESLEVSIPLSQSTALSKTDAPLMRDIQMLTEILSDLVEKEDPRVHELCEEFLEYGEQRYVDGVLLDVVVPTLKIVSTAPGGIYGRHVMLIRSSFLSVVIHRYKFIVMTVACE